jgi:hypothetical protein
MKQKPVALECSKCHPEKDAVKNAEAAILRLGKNR